MDIIKVVLIGIVTVIAAMLIRQKEPAVGNVLSLGVGVCIMACLMSRVVVLVEYLDELLEPLSFSKAYLGILLKAVGITMVTEFGASLCRENGFLALADSIRVFGKISVLMLGLPILSTVVKTIGGFEL
ncbi:MAG: hypothetical protein J6K26_09030 [Lachnospiraceae bacterium]|nr:hypothetical protein [Lachnospiraceae bacterium]